MLTALVVVVGCHEGDAIVDPPLRSPTPTPVPAVQLTGTWTGRFRLYSSPEQTVPVRIVQGGNAVRATWILDVYGATRFNGTLDGTQLSGRLSAEHSVGPCWIDQATFRGEASPNLITLAGTGFCFFDPVRISLTLTR